MKSQLFGQEYVESTSNEPFVLQNARLLKVNLDGEIHARQGSMVAYQGDVEFEFKGAGMKKLVKKMVTGEELSLMKVSGSGDVFLANFAENVHLVYLENDALTVHGEHLLALQPTLEWDVRRVKGVAGMLAGGLFNIEVRGTGWVAITTNGAPVALNAGEAPTFADVNAAVAWSSSLTTTLKKSDSIMKSMIGRGSGELVQMGFSGQGVVVVQPSEGYPSMATGQGSDSNSGSPLSSLFN